VNVRAPFLIASNIILFTKRTIGASSTSSRPRASHLVFVAAGDFQIFEIKVIVGEAGHYRFGLSMAFVTALCSLLSSTTTNSMLIEVWKRISSSA